MGFAESMHRIGQQRETRRIREQSSDQIELLQHQNFLLDQQNQMLHAAFVALVQHVEYQSQVLHEISETLKRSAPPTRPEGESR